MISEREYKLLIAIKETPIVDENEFWDDLQALLKDKLIKHNYTRSTPNALIYDGYLLTPLGDRAIEDFKRLQTTRKQQKSNSIKSTFALIFSAIATIVGLISLIISIT